MSGLGYNIQIVDGVEVTIGNYFPSVGNTTLRRSTDNVSNYLVCYTSNNQKIRHTGKQLHFTSNNDVIVGFVRSVYYLDMLELIKYYLARKVSTRY